MKIAPEEVTVIVGTEVSRASGVARSEFSCESQMDRSIRSPLRITEESGPRPACGQ